jgi:hypothetical protein
VNATRTGTRTVWSFRLVRAGAVLVCLIPTSARAQEFRPDLGQTLDWILAEESAFVEPPPLAPERTLHPIAVGPPRAALSELPGRPFHELDPPPRKLSWWKTPLYAVLGFPRDLIDSVFGAIGYIPLVNLPVVGVYEYTPLQYIMRDPRDWHGYGGVENKNGHGWRPRRRIVRDARAGLGGGDLIPHENGGPDVWIRRTGWGWFPTASQVEFTRIDGREIERREAENETMRAELRRLNEEIERRNQQREQWLADARREAASAVERGDAFEAVCRALPLHEALPGDDEVHALYLSALALYGDEGPDWTRPALWREIEDDAGPRVLARATPIVDEASADRPNHRTLRETRLALRARAGDAAGARELARADFEARPEDPRAARLFFETALSAGDPEGAERALSALRLDPAARTPLELRLMLLKGEIAAAREGFARLLADAPDNPYYHYYLGCAELARLPRADRPDLVVESAFGELERAALTAPRGPLRERTLRALGFARLLASAEAPASPDRAAPGLVPFNFPIPPESRP